MKAVLMLRPLSTGVMPLLKQGPDEPEINRRLIKLVASATAAKAPAVIGAPPARRSPASISLGRVTMAGAAAWGPPSPASSLPTESDFGGGPLWRDQAEQLQDENARLRAELDALRAALAGKGGAAAGGTPAPVGHPGQLAGADKLAGFPVPGLPGNPFAGTLQAAQSAAGVGLPAPGPPEPPRLRIALPEGSTPLLRHIVAALVRNGNVPMGPSDIAHTIRNHIAEVGSGEDLGRLFDADPASATFGAMHSVFQRAKQLGVEPLLGRIKEGQHRGYFVAGLPDVARGTIAVFPTPEGDIELPDARPDTPSPPTPPAAAEPDPLAPLLSARELTFCLQNRITPSTFVSASVTLEDECKRRGGLREKEAAALAGAAAWEPGQWTAFWNFLLRFSYVWMRRSKRRGRRAQEESSDDEGGLYPAVPFFRSVDEAGRATEHYGELPPRFRPVQAASTAGSESGRRAWKPPGMPARRRMGGDAPPKRVRVSADDDTLVVEMANGTMYRLHCHDCGKTQFNNLQGYVNHVRISHNRYYPSHAEAVVDLGARLDPAEAADLRARAAEFAEDPANDERAGTPGPQQQVKRSKPPPAIREANKALKARGGTLRRMRRDGVAVLMICPTCGRDDMSTMQGFLKHIGTHGIVSNVNDAVERFGVPPEDARKPNRLKIRVPESARQPAAAAPPTTDGEGTPPSGEGAGPEVEPDLKLRRADGTLVRIVCPSCGRSNFANLQGFVHHLAVSHQVQFESLEKYAVPIPNAGPAEMRIKIALPRKPAPAAKPPRSPALPRVPAPPRAPPTPLDISQYPKYELLTERERELASSLRITPDQFLGIKHLFVDECRKRGGLGRRAARQMVKIDVNKSSKVWEYLQEMGLVWPPPGGPSSKKGAGVGIGIGEVPSPGFGASPMGSSPGGFD